MACKPPRRKCSCSVMLTSLPWLVIRLRQIKKTAGLNKTLPNRKRRLILIKKRRSHHRSIPISCPQSTTFLPVNSVSAAVWHLQLFKALLKLLLTRKKTMLLKPLSQVLNYTNIIVARCRNSNSRMTTRPLVAANRRRTWRQSTILLPAPSKNLSLTSLKGVKPISPWISTPSTCLTRSVQNWEQEPIGSRLKLIARTRLQ